MLVESLVPGLQLGQEPFDRRTEKTWRLGTLAPGQSETVEYQATARAAGRLCTAAEATAAGGLISEPARHCVNVGSRDVTLEIEGPRTAYAKRPVNFFLTVRNGGTLPAADVVVTNTLPEGLEFSGGQPGRALPRRPGPLGPGHRAAGAEPYSATAGAVGCGTRGPADAGGDLRPRR